MFTGSAYINSCHAFVDATAIELTGMARSAASATPEVTAPVNCLKQISRTTGISAVPSQCPM